MEELNGALKSGRSFRTQIEILHPALRMLMCLKPGDEVHHDVQVCHSNVPLLCYSQCCFQCSFEGNPIFMPLMMISPGLFQIQKSQDPVTLQEVLTISQVL